MDDNSILQLFGDRREDALEEVRYKYGSRLFRVAMNITKSREDADECVNDTLLRAWNAIPPQQPTLLGAFLAKITRNLALNRLESRTAARRGGGEMPLVLNELEECVPALAANRPEQAFENAEITAAVNAFVGTLDSAVRVQFVLRYFYGESINNIATRFKLSESSVKSTLFRTRKKLHAHLSKEGVFP